ncbi:Uncharacterised protein [Achromobacter xylosoxidans]|nr:Uncharacterised protein [Achromobacter xylosoxidans]CUI48549.1 Uncharacterised protein [Achromobacter xylosoxidans]
MRRSVLVHGVQNRGLGDVAEIALGGRLPPCGHVQPHGLRQFRAGLLLRGARRHHVHGRRDAHGQQTHQLVLRLRLQRSEQVGAVLRQGFARDFLQGVQRHGGGRFRHLRGDAFQPVLHFQAHAERQAVAVVSVLQDSPHHAMHQRGQRDVRMPSHFDLQSRRAVRAQPLRQPVGQACGLGRFVVVAFLVVRAIACAETLPQLFERPQRLRLGLAQQAAMNHGLAFAVERDDRTGHSAHVRGVVAQTIFDGLQFFGHVLAARFQRLGLVLALRVVGFFQFGVDLFEAGLQGRDTAGFAGGRFAALARRVLERLAVGVAHMRHGFHPRPALGAHVLSQRVQLVAYQRFQQCGVGQIGSGIAFREQVAADAASFLHVGVQTDETHQRMRGGDFALGQAITQRGCAALPFGRTIVRGFLCGVIVGDGQGHQLFQRGDSGAVVGQQARRDVRQLQAALHHQRGHAEIGGNVFDGSAFLDQRGEGRELVGGVHGLALHILGKADGTRRRIGHQQARHLNVGGDALFLRQQLQCGQAAVACDDFVLLGIVGKNDDKVLQQADTGNARGQFGDGLARGRADVALGTARQQLRQRNQNQVLGRVSHFQRRDSFEGDGFGFGNGVHGDNSLRLGMQQREKRQELLPAPAAWGFRL